MNVLSLIGRKTELFGPDIASYDRLLGDIVKESRFLVIGGAGSIGQAVTREIFKRGPRCLHVVDISENNLVELVRDIRSTLGYIDGDFRTFALDCASQEYEALINQSREYHYVLNLSALKHVRSEKDPFTLMRLIDVNIFNTIKIIQMAKQKGINKYFCVSTDKAANPVNLMGASKRVMEMFLMRESESIDISMARFANVAFSDGSLLHGFQQRFVKRQPISAPRDVRRYFLTPEESGELCLMSCLLGENRDIFYPKLCEELHLITFSEIAERFVNHLGYEPYHCSNEEEARERSYELIANKKWPCYFFQSDTSGEKDFEEFYTSGETLDISRFQNIGIIKSDASYNGKMLDEFLASIDDIRSQMFWEKTKIVDLFKAILPDFNHKETGKYLDSRM